MKILVFTNILTPYRMALFRELERQLQGLGGRLRVVAMADTEPDRSWNYAELESDFTSQLKHVSVSVGGVQFHLNRGLAMLLKQSRPDVVICAGSYTLPTVWQALLYKLLGAHYLTLFWSESHLNEVHERSLPLRALRLLLRKIVYRLFDGFLYSGALSREFIERYAGPKSEMFFFPNTVDDDFYNRKREELQGQRGGLRQRYGVEESKYVFLTPARLTAVKGLDRVLDLVKDMNHREQAVFLVAGTGELEQFLRLRAQEVGVDMRLLGGRSAEEIAELYALADCLLLPSIADPNPLSVIEGLWSGLPVLVSRHVGNYPEAVRWGVNGYVFDYSDPAAATSLFDRIVECDNAWAAAASAASLDIAHETYDSAKVVGRLLHELSRTLE